MVKNVLKRAVASNATKSSLALMNKIAASELGKTTISAAKTAGNELATSAISTASNIAVDERKQFLEKTRNKMVVPAGPVIATPAAAVPSGPMKIEKVRSSKDPSASVKRAKRAKGSKVAHSNLLPAFATGSAKVDKKRK